MRLLTVATVIVLLWGVQGDVYMHHPRGSNNRLNERSAERDNGNRLFDSQNNNRGGYNVGDKSDNPFPENNPFRPPAETFDYTTAPQDTQYQFVWYEGSNVLIEWANQHGCGGHEGTDTHKLNCEIHLQYMCDAAYDPTKRAAPAEELNVLLRDGGNTATPDEPNDYAGIATTFANNNGQQRGRHESEAWYYACKRRQRNYAIFHADQNLNGNSMQFTRQNNNGNRRGLECPEERDYYPYWNPIPWIDIATMTDHVEKCADWYLPNSQNNNTICWCDGLLDTATANNLITINETECGETIGATWKCNNKGMPPPTCGPAAWSRVNHLGNGRMGQMNNYNWTLPKVDDLVAYGATLYDGNFVKCILRLRYNISTDDYDAYNIDYRMDDDERNGIVSPIRQNPTIDIGSHDLVGLRLAINTNQFGRTFQDRSHVFYIRRRPTNVPADATVWNLNIRGKRGNIVQTYPSVEYDFVPNRLHVAPGTFVHVQWTGSNTHNNGNPAGDGQAGDAGEGTGGTDRHNFVQIRAPNENYPLPLDKFGTLPESIWPHVTCSRFDGVAVTNWVDCALILATSNTYKTVAEANAATTDFNPTLDDAPASLTGGIVLEIGATASGKTFFYTCTRNNNFSNRSQKGVLIVT